MTRYRLDNQIADALALFPEEMAEAPEIPRGDWAALRTRIGEEYAALAALAPPVPTDVDRDDITIADDRGSELQARWYTRGDDRPGAAVVYAHGGGMIAGGLDDYDQIIATYVSRSGVPFLSVAYGLSPEVPGAQPAEDLVSGVAWLGAHAAKLGVDPARIAVMGDSAGGGVAASAAILARDRDIAVAHQILIYPMLDDRVTTASPAIESLLAWSADMNATGWQARIDGAITPATAPARLEDFRNLPPAFVEVGDLDLFRGESLSYAQRLSEADVPIELHVYPCAPHGYDMMAPDSDVSRRALQDRVRVLRSL
jgi:acetyl esterase/lipase